MGQFKRKVIDLQELANLNRARPSKRTVLVNGACLVHFVSRKDIGELRHIFSKPVAARNAPGNYSLRWIAPKWLEVMAQHCFVPERRR